MNEQFSNESNVKGGKEKVRSKFMHGYYGYINMYGRLSLIFLFYISEHFLINTKCKLFSKINNDCSSW